MNAEDLSRLQPPPRDIPLEVRVLVRLARVEGAMFFVILGALLGWAVVPNTDWRAFLFLSATEGTRGVVVNAEERGFQESKKTVWRVHFEFDRGGKRETGNSHFVGTRPRIGEEVVIEWPRGRPHLTRIADARTAPLHRGALAILFLPLFALMMTQAAWKMASPVIQGMRDGVPSAKEKESGLVNPATRELTAPTGSIPDGVNVGFDGAWTVDSSARLTRPVVMAGLASLSASLLGWALFEMGNQL